MTVAFRLLSRRARSETEMRLALERRDVPDPEVRKVLGRLRELGYIDDLKFAAEWSERLRDRGFGSLRIRDQLQRYGIEERIAAGTTPDAGEERLIARKVLEGRFGETRFTDRREKARAYRFLASRGFPDEVVESVLGLSEIE